MTKDKNGQNRGGARVQINQYKKLRIEAFEMLEHLVKANSILVKNLEHNEDIKQRCYEQMDKDRKFIQELQEEIASLKHDWRMCDEVCDNKQFKIRELEQELEQLRKERLN
jgi:3-methyladenine DNA glycosylase AlkD